MSREQATELARNQSEVSPGIVWVSLTVLDFTSHSRTYVYQA
jgi:hypothetical protein